MKHFLILMFASLTMLFATEADVCATNPSHPLCQVGQITIPVDGVDGIDGADAVVDYTAINAALQKNAEFTSKTSAGNTAATSIDFGTTKKGVTEVGVGFGYSDLGTYKEKAGAVAFKHGLTDVDAVIFKGWRATGNDANAVGIGFTHRF